MEPIWYVLIAVAVIAVFVVVLYNGLVRCETWSTRPGTRSACSSSGGTT